MLANNLKERFRKRQNRLNLLLKADVKEKVFLKYLCMVKIIVAQFLTRAFGHPVLL